ncbi:MAG: hypothetical protein AB1659_07900 [Thermodesulfobacteriota bacterium]
METPDIASDDPQLQMAKRVVTSLILAIKNYNLYPEGHENRKRSMEQFQNPLVTYLNRNGPLRLEIEKNRICFKGDEIYSETASEGNLPAIFYRDGLKWVEFQDGIQPLEIFDFLKLINKYWVLSTEPEGDLVTAFWEAEFSHINYLVSDFYWGVESSDDFKINPKAEESADRGGLEAGESIDESWRPISISQVEITPREEIQIQEMVRTEDERDVKIDFLNILLDNLIDQEEIEGWKIATEVIKEEFIEFIKSRDFKFAYTILDSLDRIYQKEKSTHTLLSEFLDDFFISIYSEDTLKSLGDHFNLSPDEVIQLKKILFLLPPGAVSSLAAIMLKTKSVHIKQICNDVIIKLSSQDIQPLTALLSSPNENLVQRLVYMLGIIRTENADQLLMNITRHSSPLVRNEAIKGLLRRNPSNLLKVFHFVDDPNDSIRRLILTFAGREKNPEAEKLLTAYIEKKESGKFEKKDLLECYQALGRCGTIRSIPFLQKMLMQPGWLPSKRLSANRQGAAMSLAAIGNPEALSVLENASRSANPGIRIAAGRALRAIVKTD